MIATTKQNQHPHARLSGYKAVFLVQRINGYVLLGETALYLVGASLEDRQVLLCGGYC